ncbi:MAG: hypothetical protein R2824_30970 [Saprospiraceae bacterium]
MITKRTAKVFTSLLCGYLLLCTTASAQTGVSVADENRLLEAWKNVILPGEAFREEEQKFKAELLLLVEALQKRYHEILIDAERCFIPPGLLENWQQELINKQQALVNAEAILTDTIPAAREKLASIIRNRLDDRLTEMSVSGKYGVLLRRSQILYQEADYPIYFVGILPTEQEKHYFQIAIEKQRQNLKQLFDQAKTKLKNVFDTP